jgi:hypothetical protein
MARRNTLDGRQDHNRRKILSRWYFRNRRHRKWHILYPALPPGQLARH